MKRNGPYTREMEDSLIGMSLMIEMARADGFIDVNAPLHDEKYRKLYNHYIDCFLRVLRRMVEQGECTVSLR